ncbi:MAG TPA: ATP-binding protein [Gemmatimonadaceae bacterium]|jgi:signal transduction histidine kinase|nr:ATP-binding protein [Gemmatimonadaceae bacterium]
MPSSSRFTSKHSNDRLVAEGALDALADGYVVVSPSWYVLFENPASERMLGAPKVGRAGRMLWDAIPAFAESPAVEALRATMTDAKPRTFPLVMPGRSNHIPYDVRVTANPSGGVCIQVREGACTTSAALMNGDDAHAEATSIRDVARALAEEMELDALLQLICVEAAAQCHADGATIGQLDGDEVEVVAGTGVGEVSLGLRFALAGSFSERAFTARTTVRADNYMEEYPAVAALRPEFEVGPALMVPLIAQNRVLGALMIVRRPGAPQFSETDERRTRVIADHAALAMRKSQLFEEAQEANRAKSEFMATMSHELRTPLTALTGYEELLVDEVFGPLTEQQLGAVERMRTSTELLTVIIDEILTFSRLEAGEEPVRPRTCTAQEILRAAAAVLEPLTLPKRLDLVLLLPDTPIELFTDPDMVRRILVNLGANAVKFTDSGLVELSVACQSGAVRFAVRDTGIGIAEHDLPRLFRPFTQLDSGFTRRHGGTGLGLFISQRLAVLLGGTIEVDSTLGEGSVFTLVVPRETVSE